MFSYNFDNFNLLNIQLCTDSQQNSVGLLNFSDSNIILPLKTSSLNNSFEEDNRLLKLKIELN